MKCNHCGKEFVDSGRPNKHGICSESCRTMLWCKTTGYYERNADRINKANQLRNRLKKESDPIHRLIHNMASWYSQVVKKRGVKGLRGKKFGCSPEFLKKHFESKFEPGMNWENYGTYWVVDHVLPYEIFDLSNPEAVRFVCNWRNLRPLRKDRNTIKGSRVLYQDKSRLKRVKESWLANPGLFLQ